jgi:hypothetical protein
MFPIHLSGLQILLLYLLFNGGPANLFFDFSVNYPGKITFQIHKSKAILIHSHDEIFYESKFDVQRS